MSSPVLLGSYTDSIHTLYFTPPSDPGATDGTLTVGPSHKVIDNPSWVAQHPAYPDLVYTISEDEEKDGKVVVARVSDDASSLKIEAEVSSQGPAPAHCNVVANGAALAVANYMGSSVLLIPLLPNGLFSPAEDHTLIELPFHPTQSPLRNMDRQDKPHPHQAVHVVVDGEYEVWVPDLGGDKVWRLKITTEQGKMGFKIKEGEDLVGDEGGGPRHILVSEDAKHLYTLNELRPALIHHELNGSSSEPQLKSKTSIVPPPPAEPKDQGSQPSSAELLFLPTKPNQTILASTRTLADRPVDSLVMFEVQEGSGEVVLKDFVFPRKGREFRAVGVSKCGKYVMAAGQEDGWVSVFGQDPSGTWVEVVEKQVQVEKPTGVLFL